MTRHVFDNRQHTFLADTLHHLLVHGDGGRHDARADVGQVGQFEQSLHGAVLAEGAVQDGEDHVDVRDARPARAGSAAGSHLPCWSMKYSIFSYLSGSSAVHDGLRRAHRDFVLAAAAAIDDGNS